MNSGRENQPTEETEVGKRVEMKQERDRISKLSFSFRFILYSLTLLSLLLSFLFHFIPSFSHLSLSFLSFLPTYLSPSLPYPSIYPSFFLLVFLLSTPTSINPLTPTKCTTFKVNITQILYSW